MRNILHKIKTYQIFLVFFVLLISIITWGLMPSRDSALSSASNIFNFCQKNLQTFGTKEVCYSQQFKKFAAVNGPDTSFKSLFALQRLDPDAIGCHLIAHGIGWGSYQKDPSDWRTLIRDMNPTCNYGAIHGVLEQYINSLPGKSLTPEIIPTICGDQPRADCNHIVGHLLLVETRADVPKALKLCDVFDFSSTQKDFCITGVFMEEETALNLVQHDIVPQSWLDWPARLSPLEKLCRSFSGANAEGCWQEIVHVALAKFQNDPVKTWAFCNTAQVPEGAKRCVRHSIGIIGASKNFDLPALKSMCEIPQKNNPNFQGECYGELVGSALSTIPKMAPEAKDFCNSLEEKFQAPCLSMVDSYSNNSLLIKND
jgi:hypothetical protein